MTPINPTQPKKSPNLVFVEKWLAMSDEQRDGIEWQLETNRPWVKAPTTDEVMLGMACTQNLFFLAQKILEKNPAIVHRTLATPTPPSGDSVLIARESSSGALLTGTATPLGLPLVVAIQADAKDIQRLLLEQPSLDVNTLPYRQRIRPLDVALDFLTITVRKNGGQWSSTDFALVDALLEKGANPFLSATGYPNESPFNQILDRMTRADLGEGTAMTLFYIAVMGRFLEALPRLGLAADDPLLDPEQMAPAFGNPPRDAGSRSVNTRELLLKHPGSPLGRWFTETIDRYFDPKERLAMLHITCSDDILGEDAQQLKAALRQASGLFSVEGFAGLVTGWLNKAGYGGKPLEEILDATHRGAGGMPGTSPAKIDSSALQAMSDDAIGNLLKNCQSELFDRLRKRQESQKTSGPSLSKGPAA